MKTKKSTIKLADIGFNEMPGRAVVEALLEKIPYGVEAVDFGEPEHYWHNAEDTLVVAIDGEELYRFGGKTIAEALMAVMELTHRTGADEVDTARVGSKVIIRMWWD